jgi:hypothetical protein
MAASRPFLLPWVAKDPSALANAQSGVRNGLFYYGAPTLLRRTRATVQPPRVGKVPNLPTFLLGSPLTWNCLTNPFNYSSP